MPVAKAKLCLCSEWRAMTRNRYTYMYVDIHLRFVMLTLLISMISSAASIEPLLQNDGEMELLVVENCDKSDDCPRYFECKEGTCRCPPKLGKRCPQVLYAYAASSCKIHEDCIEVAKFSHCLDEACQCLPGYTPSLYGRTCVLNSSGHISSVRPPTIPPRLTGGAFTEPDYSGAVKLALGAAIVMLAGVIFALVWNLYRERRGSNGRNSARSGQPRRALGRRTPPPNPVPQRDLPPPPRYTDIFTITGSPASVRNGEKPPSYDEAMRHQPIRQVSMVYPPAYVNLGYTTESPTTSIGISESASVAEGLGAQDSPLSQTGPWISPPIQTVSEMPHLQLTQAEAEIASMPYFDQTNTVLPYYREASQRAEQSMFHANEATIALDGPSSTSQESFYLPQQRPEPTSSSTLRQLLNVGKNQNGFRWDLLDESMGVQTLPPISNVRRTKSGRAPVFRHSSCAVTSRELNESKKENLENRRLSISRSDLLENESFLASADPQQGHPDGNGDIWHDVTAEIENFVTSAVSQQGYPHDNLATWHDVNTENESLEASAVSLQGVPVSTTTISRDINIMAPEDSHLESVSFEASQNISHNSVANSIQLIEGCDNFQRSSSA